MYASEAELNAVEARLLSVQIVASNLKAQIEGTYIFQSVQPKSTVIRRIQEAGFYFVERVNIHDVLNEYKIAPEREAAPAAEPPADVQAVSVPDGWEPAGAYSHKAGAIRWENGYVAIKQFAESATGKEHDSRFMHETLDAIHAIAAQEVENAKDDSWYSELLDELSGQIKRLERENARLTKGLMGLKRQIVPTGDAAYDLGRETAYTLISELVDSILRGDTWTQDTAAQQPTAAGDEGGGA